MVEPMKKRKQPYRTFTEAMPPGGSTGSHRSSAMVVGNVKHTLSCAAMMRPVSTHRLLNKSPAPHVNGGCPCPSMQTHALQASLTEGLR